ncbi:MAG: glycoside hydrolase family 65 central catalytic [Clostridia bacterium]|jgi:kojibiose phosphorylase|nr:glycoside hydrolase family 65 central catalytic [Clostridia bacterium]
MKKDKDREWLITEDCFDMTKNKYYEGAFCQGNGYFSIRASFEEGLDDAPQGEYYNRAFKSVTTEMPLSPKSKWGTYVPLIMGSHPNLNEVIINLPYFMAFKISFNEESLDMEACHIEDFKQTLCLKDGTLTRTFKWHTKDGSLLRLNYFRFPSMCEKHLFVEEIEAEVISGKGALYIQSGIDGRVTTNGYSHFTQMEAYEINDYIALKCKTDQEEEVLEVSETISPNCSFEISKDEKSIYHTSELLVSEGNTYTFQKRVLILTSRDLELGSIEERAKGLVKLFSKNSKAIYEDHRKEWGKKWDLSDVVIEGDKEAQLAVRFSIYHLMRSNMEDDPRAAICAKGFAGEAYYGRYFWDTEIFILPFFIYTNPRAAKNLLMYRYLTLDGARENAAKYHSKGARYPWHSALRGDEQCSLWEYADNEVHITADIAYAIWHYYRATDDFDFLKNYGAEILVETARFWTDRVDSDGRGGFNLLNVMGPDEYSAMTRNNSFTNRMVIFNLRKAIEVLKMIKEKDENSYQKLKDKLKLEDHELALFAQIADKLPVIIDQKTGIIQQSEDFENYAAIDVQSIWKDKSRPFGFFITQEKLYRSKCLKQADALALAMLFKNEFTKEQIENTYDYYEPLTTHDSSLSPVNHAIVAAWLDKREHVDKFIKYAMELDFNPEIKGAAEGIHIANCGCLWQFIMTAAAGIQTASMEEKPISRHSYLPSGWDKVSFKIIWKDQHYHITVIKDKVEVNLC